MRVTLEYGRTGLEVELPDDRVVGLLAMQPAPALEDPGAILLQKLARPTGTPPLAELARGRKSACIDTRYIEADLKITTGLIEPHLMAGYSGGRKLICPGIAALETVKVWHGPDFLEHPRADCGFLEGNPVHEENTRIARMAGCDFIVNVCIDGQRRILSVGAGHMEKPWLEGVRFVAGVARVPVPALRGVVA